MYRQHHSKNIGSSISPGATDVSRLIACRTCVCSVCSVCWIHGRSLEKKVRSYDEQSQGEVTLRELAIRPLSPRYPGAESLQVTDLLPGQLPT